MSTAPLDEKQEAILKDVLRHHGRMERDKCSCGRGWLPEPYSYIDHFMAVLKEALNAASG